MLDSSINCKELYLVWGIHFSYMWLFFFPLITWHMLKCFRNRLQLSLQGWHLYPLHKVVLGCGSDTLVFIWFQLHVLLEELIKVEGNLVCLAHGRPMENLKWFNVSSVWSRATHDSGLRDGNVNWGTLLDLVWDDALYCDPDQIMVSLVYTQVANS